MPLSIGLRHFNDAYQFKFIQCKNNLFYIRHKLATKVANVYSYHSYTFHTHKVKTTCRVNQCLVALEFHLSRYNIKVNRVYHNQSICCWKRSLADSKAALVFILII
jgi:type IV secretory pathway TraG/TraD family ATPase VirD4